MNFLINKALEFAYCFHINSKISNQFMRITSFQWTFFVAEMLHAVIIHQWDAINTNYWLTNRVRHKSAIVVLTA